MPDRAGGYDLPEAVGTPLTREQLAEIVQRSCVQMAADMRFERMVVLSFAPNERMLRVVTTVGFSLPEKGRIGAPVDRYRPIRDALDGGKIVVADQVEGSLPSVLVPHFSGPLGMVPLLVGERRVAILCGQPEPGVSLRSDLWRESAESAAEKAALVAECERLQAACQEFMHQQLRAREVAAAILQQRSLSEILSLIVRHLDERLDIDRVGIYLQRDGSLQPTYLHNISDEYGAAVERFATSSPIIRHAAETSMPFVVDNIDQRPEMAYMSEHFVREEIRAIVVAPLQYGTMVQGVLGLYPRTRRRFTPLEMSALKIMADQAALAIAVTRFLEQQREAAMVLERNRLAREIHDTVAQALSGVVLQLDAASSLLSQPAALSELLAETRDLARHALEETRRSVLGLTPTPLERLSLPEAIAQELETFGHTHRLRTAFVHVGEEKALSTEHKTALFRIAQEALNNVRKHAQAERVRMALEYGADDVRLTVEDDGGGFDTAEVAGRSTLGGYGLFGMRERARLLGGDLRIESTVGWGTRIVASFPWGRATPRPVSVLPPAAAPAPGLDGAPAAPPDREPLGGRLGERAGLPLSPSPLLMVSLGGSGAAAPSSSAPPTDAIRVLVVDDHVLARQGIHRMLEGSGDIVVVGEAEDGFEALERIDALRPDVVLMDMQMPRLGGLATLQRLQVDHPELPVIVLTSFESDDMLLEAIHAGARGYLLKSSPGAQILDAIRAARRGESLLPPALTARLLERMREEGGVRPRSAEISDRERELLQLLARGARNREIAQELYISEKTVEFHLRNLFGKLGVSNRTEAARYALDHGLVLLEPDDESGSGR